MPSPTNVAQRPQAAAKPPTVTMGDRMALAKATAAAAIAAEASKQRQIAYDIEQERIVAGRKRRQTAEQEQRERDARQRATAAAVRPPLPPFAVGSTRHGSPDENPARFWRLSADHTCWWFEDEGWWAYHI